VRRKSSKVAKLGSAAGCLIPLFLLANGKAATVRDIAVRLV
jgi:hypothetical protein